MATKITSWEGKDNRGRPRTISFYEKNGKIVQTIEKVGGTNNKITYRGTSFHKLFKSMFEIKEHIDDGAGSSNADILAQNMDEGTEGKMQMLEQIADSMEQGELEDNASSEEVKELRKKLISKGITKRPYAPRDIEKTKEHVLQKTYERLGTDWFPARDFKEMYNKNFENSEPKVLLSQMAHKELQRREVPDDKYDDWRVNYEYRLADQIIDRIEEYGSLISENDPRFAKKQYMIPDNRRD